MSKLDPNVMRKMAVGLSVVAMITIIAAAVVGYVRKGEVNWIIILPFIAVLASSFLIYAASKKNAEK